MEKKRLTDGLLQIAILLSLLRSNVDEYLHIISGYNANEYELSEILLGSTSVITQTHTHNNNWDNDLGAYVHPKNIDNFISRSVFRDLHNLGDYNQVESPMIAAYLLPSLERRLQSENANSNNNEEATSDTNNNNSPQGSSSNTGTPSLTSSQDEGLQIPLSPSDGDELSQEDMDLIEILWRQDIDMGVGKECFDVSLRRELEKEQELEDAKQKQKEEERNETAAQLLELSHNVNFVVDGETGELVPALESSTQDRRPRLTSQQGLSIEDAIEILQNEHAPSSGSAVTPPGELTSPRSFGEELESLISELPQVPLIRQASIERRWDDVQDLLGVQLDSNSTSTLATPLPTPPHATPVLPFVTPQPYVVTSSTSSYDVTGSEGALLQNATLGGQAMNTTELLAATIDTPVLPENDTDSLFALNTTDTALFPNASVTNNTNFLLDLLEENNRDAVDIPFSHSTDLFRPVKHEDPLSDSAVGSMGSSVGSASPFNSEGSSNITSPFNITELEGATGGLQDIWSAPKDNKEASRFQFYPDPQQPSPDYQFPDQSNLSDTNSTDMPPITPANPRHIQHNHTYPALPGQQPKERKCDVNARMMRNRTSESRDEKKAKRLQIPFTIEEIIHSPVERFTDMLAKTKLTDPQLQLMKDIRRRGKNKVAAQNCRKRKMEVIETLEEEVERMRQERDTLSKTRGLIDKEKTKIREKYNALYREVFNSLRDENGQPYDPNHFTLQHTADGNVFLVPKNTTSLADRPSNEKKSRKDAHKK